MVETSLGYILYRNGKRINAQGAYLEFESDAHPRHKTLAMRTASRFAVYYKHNGSWQAVPQNLQTLIECIPFLQNGQRVLIEYDLKQPVETVAKVVLAPI